MDAGAWKAAVHGVAKSQTRLSNFTFTFHFHALEKEMATHSSVLAWRIPGTGEPGGLWSMGLHRVGQDWSDLAAAAGIHQPAPPKIHTPGLWAGANSSFILSLLTCYLGHAFLFNKNGYISYSVCISWDYILKADLFIQQILTNPTVRQDWVKYWGLGGRTAGSGKSAWIRRPWNAFLAEVCMDHFFVWEIFLSLAYTLEMYLDPS